MSEKISSIQFFAREGNAGAKKWQKKIEDDLAKNFPQVKILEKDAEGIIVFGGDGTILQAARTFREQRSVVFGLNLGTVGFLASVRDEKDFLTGLHKFINGDYQTEDHMLLSVAVTRNKEVVFTGLALNDVVIHNLLGMVDLDVRIKKHLFQSIRGSGLLVSTPTGSTAYNLSAHGPILMPEIRGIIITELLDHGIPTPSIVVNEDKQIDIEVKSFRQRGILTMKGTKEAADVLIVVDGEAIMPLAEHDRIIVARSKESVRFAKLEDSYFLKSLEEKFAFN